MPDKTGERGREGRVRRSWHTLFPVLFAGGITSPREWCFYMMARLFSFFLRFKNGRK
jgi:hypothetical protein